MDEKKESNLSKDDLSLQEKEQLEELRRNADRLLLPDSLRPAAVQRILEEVKQKKTSHFRFKKIYRFAFAAAFLILILAAGTYMQPIVNLRSVSKLGLPNLEPAKGGQASSYREIYKIVTDLAKHQNYYIQNEAAYAGEMSDGAASTSVKDSSPNNSYSKTNAQVDGVAEADIVQTDGSYFYIYDVSKNMVRVVKADGAKLSSAAAINPLSGAKDMQVIEMYVSGNRLVLLLTDMLYNGCEIAASRDTYQMVYDITNPEKPCRLSSLKQDGSYISSRLRDNILYVFTSYHLPYTNPEKYGEEDLIEYVPKVDGCVLPYDQVFLPENPLSAAYTVVTSVNLENPEDFYDSKAVLADASQSYVSTESIYFANYVSYREETKKTQTELIRFHYDKGNIIPAGSTYINGWIDSQFSMDEKDGFLRLVSTVEQYYAASKYYDGMLRSNGQTNSLYILDENLKVVGSIENLAKNERIYSARFLNDIAYFVTFRQVDPLFSVDISDPYNPVLLGQLKIPGFSDYLHPYGDGLLLGFGMDADTETGEQLGIKLTMFDITDPGNVQELHSLIMPEYHDSQALYNHKSILVSPERNLIGFPAAGADFIENTEQLNYLTYEFDKDKGFSQTTKAGYDVNWKEEYGRTSYLNKNMRGAYIGDNLYVINPEHEIWVFDLNTYNLVENFLFE